MSFFRTAPEPKSPLGLYRMLAPSAGVRVSPLCLGAMNFGDAWKEYMGECGKEQTEAILDFFYENGGNFIDTANNYQAEQSEQWIGDWMSKRQNRDQIVIATKYTTAFRAGHGDKEIIINSMGNGAKSMHVSVAASLAKLKTTYIDLLWVHWWDYTTQVEEVMHALNVLVNQGKVLYLGISDTPAWIIVKANAYARQHGLRPFSVWQGRWSAEHRDVERDVIQMCASEGMAMAPWGTLGGGAFKTKEQRKAIEEKAQKEGRNIEISPSTIKVAEVLEKVAERKKTLLTSVALAYVMHKTPYVFPIIGGRNIDHLKGNIEALKLKLTDEDIKEIESAKEFDRGFPASQFGHSADTTWLSNLAGFCEYVPEQKPIVPKTNSEGETGKGSKSLFK